MARGHRRGCWFTADLCCHTSGRDVVIRPEPDGSHFTFRRGAFDARGGNGGRVSAVAASHARGSDSCASMRIVSERLHNQRLSATTFRQPVEVVRWMGAVQAQDYHGAKWALGLRMRAATDRSIEDAFNNGEIIRTHLLRPTWHFVAPEDIRWLLELTGPRVDLRCGSGYRMFELDAAVFKRSNRAITNALKGGKHLTRPELKAVLNRAGVAADNGIRLGHILIRAELDGVVCSGPRKGKQFTYALLEERVPPGKSLARDEALAELTRRYFRSHGPASLQDYVWWSGLTTEDAKRGIALTDRELTTTTTDNKVYFAPVSRSSPRSQHPSNLLPAFDEYNVAYKHRGLVNDLMPAWNALGPAVIIDGKITGAWKATTSGGNVTIQINPARPLKKPELQSINEVADRYAAFLGRDKATTEIRNTKL